MNLDLGATIWLNVTRKLLSFHKWFFVPPNETPLEFRRELTHHSHTHPSVTIESFGSYQGAHDNPYTTLIYCGNPTNRRHAHIIGNATEAPHLHNFTIGFAAANLGSPWYNHVHVLITEDVTLGGAPHPHTINSPTWTGYCAYLGCSFAPHTHTTNLTAANGGSNHNDHACPVWNTETAEVDDSPDNHRHYIENYGSIFSTYSSPHTHTISGTIGYTVCFGGTGWNHNHVLFSYALAAANHTHQIPTGYTGYGGEPEKGPFGDGLVWIT